MQDQATDKVLQLKQRVTDALDQLAEQLESGASDKLTAYLQMVGRLHRYSMSNVLLIMGQCPQATHVAGFRTWRTLGRYVRKGERGIRILAPMVRKSRTEEFRGVAGSTNDAHKTADRAGFDDDQQERIIRGFRVVSVFDVSQTDGEPLPDIDQVRGDAAGLYEHLSAWLHSRGISVERQVLGSGVSGMVSDGRIVIDESLRGAQAFSVLVHEAAHELLHRDGDGCKLNRQQREVEAEAVACAVCSGCQLEVGTSSADYIGLYRGDRQLLVASLSRISEVATQLLGVVAGDGIAKSGGSRSEASAAA